MIHDLPLYRRLWLAPGCFARLLAIGAGRLSLLSRLTIACRLTVLLLLPLSTAARPFPASESSRSNGD